MSAAQHSLLRTVTLGLLLGAGAAACARTSAPVPRSSLLSGLAAPPPFQSPARWDYHPQRVALDINASAPTGQGQVYITQRGERWLRVAGPSGVQVAPMLAREPLLSLIDLGEQGWLFTGASGAVYSAPSPLASFEQVRLPAVPLARVSVTPTVLLGVTRTGGLQRSEDQGTTWHSVQVGGRATDVALLSSGHGLLLLAPEQLLATQDFGRTWASAEHAAFGAVELRAAGDAIVVKGVLGGQRYVPTATPVWQPDVEQKPKLEAQLKAGSRASAKALAAGQAVFTQGRYYEVSRAGKRWRVQAGNELDVLAQKSISGPGEECEAVRLAAFQEQLLLACVEEASGVAPTRLWSSRDAGATWRREPFELRADSALLQLAVLQDGRWLISGICPLHAADGGCVPRGVFIAPLPSERVADKAPQLQSVSVPLLDGAALGLAAASDGRRVLVLGKRTKGETLAAFTSDASLQRFFVEELTGLEASWDEDLGRMAQASVRGISVGPDDQFGISIHEPGTGENTLLVLDNTGHLLTRGKAPAGSVVGAAGAFALALDSKTGRAWESLDGGVSWQDLGLAPAPLCSAEDEQCAPEVWCWARGCVVDDEFSRLGWRGQAANQVLPAIEVENVANQQPNTLGVPLACRLDENAEWVRYPGTQLPGAEQAQLGEVAWFSLNIDWDDASVSLYEATEAAGGRAERVALFESAAAPSSVAVGGSLQVEGAAAIRITDGQPAEVAWRNLIEGRRTQRGTLPKPVRFNTRSTRFTSKLVEPELLSVSRNSLFVRPEPGDRGAVSYLVTGKGVEPLPQFAWPNLDKTGRGEMVLAEGVPLALTMIDAGAAIVRLRLRDNQWQRDAITLGLLRPKLFDVRQVFDLAYRGNAPGFHLMFLDTRHSQAWWFPFSGAEQPLGQPVAVPTQRDLPPTPSLCGADERSITPRVVVPGERGTRHPVVLTHTIEPFSALVTGQAVLFGAPQQACVAAYEARQVGDLSGESVRALVVPDTGRSSWLFRLSGDSEHFEARRMTCQFDAQVEVPSELLNETPSAPTSAEP